MRHGRSDGISPGMPAGQSHAAGLDCRRDLEDDSVPLGPVPGDRTVGDRPSQALPHSVQIAFVTMRYLIST
jgi:hypothetical protein